MKPSVNIAHEEKLITSIFSGVMSIDDMDNYFETFLNNIPAGAGYYEVVDFTGVTRFEITYDNFLVFATKASEVFISGRVATTEFIVANEQQLGMARMFAGMADEDEVEFVFTRKF